MDFISNSLPPYLVDISITIILTKISCLPLQLCVILSQTGAATLRSAVMTLTGHELVQPLAATALDLLLTTLWALLKVIAQTLTQIFTLNI